MEKQIKSIKEIGCIINKNIKELKEADEYIVELEEQINILIEQCVGLERENKYLRIMLDKLTDSDEVTIENMEV